MKFKVNLKKLVIIKIKYVIDVCKTFALEKETIRRWSYKNLSFALVKNGHLAGRLVKGTSEIMYHININLKSA